MKKLITLLLVLTGTVCTASADYYVAGSSGDIFGSTWTEDNESNKMALVDGVYTKTYPKVKITENSFQFKITDGSWEHSWPANNVEVSTNGAGYYDITFTYNPDNNTVGYTLTPRMYFVYSTNYFENHTVGDMMDFEDGVHTVTFDAVFDECFLIVPSYALNDSQDAINNWSNVISPVSDGWYYVFFQHKEDNVVTYENAKKWQIREAATYTFTYNPSTSKFIVDAESTETITSANWATYSLGTDWSETYGFTVSNAQAYYIAGTEEGKAVLTEIPAGTVIPNKAGIIVSGTGSFTVNTVGSAATNLTDNKLIGSGASTYGISGYYNATDQYTGYIFADGANGVGFYKVSGSDNTLGSHKAFLAIPTGYTLARDFFAFDNESTGIKQVMNNETQNDAIYNLQGVRMNKLQKGLNIVGGKKVLVK